MQRIRMKWFDKDPETSINQIYSKGLEYAAASRTDQCSHFVYCKDFLHDAVWANLYNTPVDIYSFNYDPKAHPLDVEDFTRMLVGNDSDEFFDKKIPNCIDFLNQVERVLHLKRTVVFSCEDPPEDYLPGGVFLLEGSQRWMTSPVLLSMYTLFIRCGFVHEIGSNYMDTLDKIVKGDIKPYQENDQSFVEQSLPGIKAIMALGYRKIFYKNIKKNYPKEIGMSVLHHDCGVRAYSWGHTKKNFPHWHRQGLLDVLKEKNIQIEYLWEVPPPPPIKEIPPYSGKASLHVSKGIKTEIKDDPVEVAELAPQKYNELCSKESTAVMTAGDYWKKNNKW